MADIQFTFKFKYRIDRTSLNYNYNYNYFDVCPMSVFFYFKLEPLFNAYILNETLNTTISNTHLLIFLCSIKINKKKHFAHFTGTKRC